MLINVFAVDPGTTTGWAFGKNADPATSPQTDCDIEFMSGQMNGDEYQQSHDLFMLIEHCWPCAIIIEDFIPRQLNQQRHFLSPVRIANQLTMLLWEANKTWLLQQPALAKTTVTDDYLKSVMLYSKGMPHANDAVRHALTFVRRVTNKPKVGIELYQQLSTIRGLDSMTPTATPTATPDN